MVSAYEWRILRRDDAAFGQQFANGQVTQAWNGTQQVRLTFQVRMRVEQIGDGLLSLGNLSLQKANSGLPDGFSPPGAPASSRPSVAPTAATLAFLAQVGSTLAGVACNKSRSIIVPVHHSNR